MKYLITGKRNVVPMPTERAAELFQGAKAWMNARLADGRLECHYVFAGLGGGFAVRNADSHEQVLDELLDYPLYPFFDWEVHSLCDYGHSYDKLTEYFQRLAG